MTANGFNGAAGKTPAQLGQELIRVIKTPIQDMPDEDTTDIANNEKLKGAKRIQQVKDLIAQGASLTETDDNGSTALTLSCSGQLKNKISEALIKAGADVNQAPNGKITALFSAAASRNDAMVKILLQEGADPNAPASAAWTPLTIAAALGQKNMCQDMLNHGGDPLAKIPGHMNAIEAAEDNSKHAVADMLKRHVNVMAVRKAKAAADAKIEAENRKVEQARQNLEDQVATGLPLTRDIQPVKVVSFKKTKGPKKIGIQNKKPKI